MNPLFYQTQAKFLQASRKRFADWGEANNHRQVGGAISEFRELFVVDSSYYERLRWIRGKKPIYYRQAQLVEDLCDRMLGRTPYGKMFSRLTKYRSESFFSVSEWSRSPVVCGP
jgi:hypothetical protein